MPHRIILALALVWSTTTFCLPCAGEDIPSGEQLIARLKKQHPRLLFDAAGLDDIKRCIARDEALQRCDEALVREADKVLKAKLPEHVIPDGLRLLATSRRVMHHTYTLAIVYRLHGDRRYAERLWEEMKTVAAFPDFNPRHFLDTAEMTHALAIAYDWLYDTWTVEQRATIRKTIVEMGLKPSLGTYNSHRGWAFCEHNWNQVCNGGMTMGALAIGDEEPALAGKILHAALEGVPHAMKTYGPDGGWPEGPGYWGYATTYNVVMLAALQTALGTDFGLTQIPGFAETGLFPIYMVGPTNRCFNFSDSGEEAPRSECLFWLGERFHQPTLSWFAKSANRASPGALLWYRTPGVDPAQAGLPLDKYFRHTEVVALRGAWNDSQTTFVAMQAGSNQRNHAHLDQGSFVLDALGQRWATDLGADDYNLPGYFGKKRYDYYRLRAEGHNTLVLNPDNGPGQSIKAECSICKFASKPARAVAVADLTSAYAAQSAGVKRGVALLDRRTVLVQDEIAIQHGDVWWFVHTPAAIELSADGREAVLSRGKARLTVRLLAPAAARFEVLPAAPSSGSPHPERQAVNDWARKLAIHLTAATDPRVAVWFVPQDGRPAAAAPAIVPLSGW